MTDAVTVDVAAAERALRAAARALADAGLVDAFGHASVRTGAATAIVTPPVPLGALDATDRLVPLRLGGDDLPAAAPREAWLHTALLTARPGVGAVCRAQPRAVAAYASLHEPWGVPNGHAALLGRVAVWPDSRLVRDADTARALVAAVGDAETMVLTGNGAVTCGRDLAAAVARMWLLERTAELLLAARAAGRAHDLPEDEQTWWRDRATELLPRIHAYLTR